MTSEQKSVIAQYCVPMFLMSVGGWILIFAMIPQPTPLEYAGWRILAGFGNQMIGAGGYGLVLWLIKLWREP